MKKILLLTIALALALASCKNDDGGDTHTHEWEWKVTTAATATAAGQETETCKTCGATSGNTRIIEQTEPTIKIFNDQVMFTDNGTDYLADIIDARTACGSQNLQQLGIVEQLQSVTSSAYNDGTGLSANTKRGRFRNVFGSENNGVTIYVDNPSTFYKAKATDSNTLYFHIDYLLSVTDTDLQTTIITAIEAMNPMAPNLPFEVE